MRRVLPAVGLLLVLAACGSSQSRGSYVIDYRPHVPRSDVTPLANRRERRAEREAARLLRSVPVPPGASRLPAPAPTDRLAQSGLGVSTVNMTADRFSVWRVPGPGASAIAFEERHMLPGLHGQGRAASPDGWISEQFSGPVVGGRPVQRAVSASVVPGDGGAVLRLDAGVSWIYPRSPREAVPAGVREIDIRGGGVSERVTSPATVSRIVRWFDALNVAQPGPAVSCMAVLAPHVRFAFRSAGGRTLARAALGAAPATNCNDIEFTIRGKRQWPLIDARLGRHAFVARVERLLGVRFGRS